MSFSLLLKVFYLKLTIYLAFLLAVNDIFCRAIFLGIYTCLVTVSIPDYLFRNIYVAEHPWKIEIVTPLGANGVFFSPEENNKDTFSFWGKD